MLLIMFQEIFKLQDELVKVVMGELAIGRNPSNAITVAFITTKPAFPLSAVT